MSLWQTFHLYSLGKADMDSRTFVKLCRENKLLDKNLTVTTCDLIFTKSKKKGANRISFEEFEEAVKRIAEKKGVEEKTIVAQISTSEGPLYTGTKTEKVRLYEDKSTYTGVHAHGGPTTVDRPSTKFNGTFSNYEPNTPSGGKQLTLEQMCDRSEPNIRGVNKSFES